MIRYLLYLAAVVVLLVVTLWAGNHYVLAPAREHGYLLGAQDTTKKLQPQIDDLSRQLTTALNTNADLNEKFSGLQSDYAAYRDAAIDAQQRFTAALAADAAREKADEGEKQRLAKIVARSRSTESAIVVCQRASALLADVIRQDAQP